MNKLNSNLYYDLGDGFSESNKISSIVELKENNFEVFYDLSTINGKIYSLRWDPIEYQPCRCMLTKVEIDKGGTLIPINSYSSIDRTDIFLNNDPIYIANDISFNIEYIRLTGKFQIIDYKEYISIFESEIDKIQQKNMNLSIDLIETTNKYIESSKKLEDSIKENKEISEKLNQKAQELSRT